MNPEISIILTAYNRAAQLNNTLRSIAQQSQEVEVVVVEDGDDGGVTKRVCDSWYVKHIQRKNRPDREYVNSAALINAGVKVAQGEIIIIQNAECMHASPDLIAKMACMHRHMPKLACFAAVIKFHEDGTCEPEPTNLRSPYFFCGSMRREWFMKLRGIDEDYTGWGMEDDDFAMRMRYFGIQFVYLPDVTVHHQWHPVATGFGLESNRALFESNAKRLHAGEIGPEANLGREWGVL